MSITVKNASRDSYALSVRRFCLVVSCIIHALVITSCKPALNTSLADERIRLVVDDSSSAGIKLRLVVPQSVIGSDRVEFTTCEVTSNMLPAPVNALTLTKRNSDQSSEYAFTVSSSTAEVRISGYRNGDYAADLGSGKTFREQQPTFFDSLLAGYQGTDSTDGTKLMRHVYNKVRAAKDTSEFRRNVLAAAGMGTGNTPVREAITSILTSHASSKVLDSWLFSSILLNCISELNDADGRHAVRSIYRAYPQSHFASAYDYFLREGLEAEDIDYLLHKASSIRDADSALTLRCTAITLALRRNNDRLAVATSTSVVGISKALVTRYRQAALSPQLLTAFNKRQILATAELKVRLSNLADTGFAEPLTAFASSFSPMDPRLGTLYFLVGKGHSLRGNKQQASMHYAAACRISPSNNLYRDSLARANSGRASADDVAEMCKQAISAGIIARNASIVTLPNGITRHVQRSDKPTLIAFVSESCAPCLEMLKEIGSSIDRFENANIVIVPIGEWRSDPQKKYGKFSYASLADNQASFARSVQIQATPAVAIFDKNNNFSQRIDGKPPLNVLVNAIARLR